LNGEGKKAAVKHGKLVAEKVEQREGRAVFLHIGRERNLPEKGRGRVDRGKDSQTKCQGSVLPFRGRKMGLRTPGGASSEGERLAERLKGTEAFLQGEGFSFKRGGKGKFLTWGFKVI